MSRIIFFVIIFAVIYFGWRAMRMRQIKLEEKLQEMTLKKEEARPVVKSERMVECAYCGTYVPEKEAIKSGQNYYCCEQHKNLGPRGRQ